MAGDASFAAAEGAQHPDAVARPPEKDVVTGSQLLQPRCLECIEIMCRRLPELVHPRKMRGDVGHRPVVQQKAHQINALNRPLRRILGTALNWCDWNPATCF